MKQVEFSKSARSSSILSGDMPGKLKSSQIIRRSAASVPRVARSEPNSSRNTDLLDEGGRYAGICLPERYPGISDRYLPVGTQKMCGHL